MAIREATGDAGIQLKRSGFKLGIGSKSIVGYVAGNGEQLIVNDTTRDRITSYNVCYTKLLRPKTGVNPQLDI